MRHLVACTLAIAVPISAVAQTIRSSVVTPANAFVMSITATGTQNDYAPVAFTGQPVVIRANNASALTITGFANPIDGQEITVVSVGAGDVLLSYQTTSTAANQLTNAVINGSTALAAGKGWARYVYDGTTAKWRLVGHEQGGWISQSFSAGSFTASGSMTWTVDSGDVKRLAYWLKGRTLFVQFAALATTVGGTASFALVVAAPGGYQPAGGADIYMPVQIKDNGTYRLGNMNWDSVAFYFYPSTTTATAGSNWTLSTNNTDMSVSFAVEVV
jgi:hypothetical protein